MSKLNSAADIKSLAAWLPMVVKALKGTKLQVKSDNKAVYVAAGTGSQYAITPTSETAGKYELQAKENGKVVVKSSGEYKNLDELVKVVTQKTNASVQAKKMLCAGRNLQNAITDGKEDASPTDVSNLSASRSDLEITNRSRRDRKDALPPKRRPLNASRQNSKPMSLRASEGMTPDLMRVIQSACKECQPVQAILYNSVCPLTGNVCLSIGFYDDEERVWVLAQLNEANVETYKTIDEVQQAMVPPTEEGVDDEFFADDFGEEGVVDDF